MKRLVWREKDISITLLLILHLCGAARRGCAIERDGEHIQCFNVADGPVQLGATHCHIGWKKMEPNERPFRCRRVGACIRGIDEGKVDVCLFDRNALRTKSLEEFYCKPKNICWKAECSLMDGECVGDYVCTIYNTRDTNAGIRVCDVVRVATTSSPTPTTTNVTEATITELITQSAAEETSPRKITVLRVVCIVIGLIITLTLLMLVVYGVWREMKAQKKNQKVVTSTAESLHPPSSTTSSSRRRSTDEGKDQSVRRKPSQQPPRTIERSPDVLLTAKCKTIETQVELNAIRELENEETAPFDQFIQWTEDTTFGTGKTQFNENSDTNRPLKRGVVKYASMFEDDTMGTTPTLGFTKKSRKGRRKKRSKHRRKKESGDNPKTQPERITLDPATTQIPTTATTTKTSTTKTHVKSSS